MRRVSDVNLDSILVNGGGRQRERRDTGSCLKKSNHRGLEDGDGKAAYSTCSREGIAAKAEERPDDEGQGSGRSGGRPRLIHTHLTPKACSSHLCVTHLGQSGYAPRSSPNPNPPQMSFSWRASCGHADLSKCMSAYEYTSQFLSVFLSLSFSREWEEVTTQEVEVGRQRGVSVDPRSAFAGLLKSTREFSI